MNVTVEIADHSAGHWVPDGELCREWVTGALAAGRRGEDALVSLCFVGARESAELNQRYRKQPRPTNVLTFPCETPLALPGQAAAAAIGDIVVCAELATEEARDQGKPVAHHWAHLVIHGCLHLLGYDHVVEADAQCMEAMETGILRGLGIPDPYPVS